MREEEFVQQLEAVGFSEKAGQAVVEAVNSDEATVKRLLGGLVTTRTVVVQSYRATGLAAPPPSEKVSETSFFGIPVRRTLHNFTYVRDTAYPPIQCMYMRSRANLAKADPIMGVDEIERRLVPTS
jgi:hypothetical protein